MIIIVGVYCYTASNALGTINGQIRVFVEEERNGGSEIMEKAESEMTDHAHELVFGKNCVNLSEWAEHVESLNESNGKGFKIEFQVLYSNFQFSFSNFKFFGSNYRVLVIYFQPKLQIIWKIKRGTDLMQ